MLIDELFEPRNSKRVIVDMQQDPEAPADALFRLLKKPDLQIFNLKGLHVNYESHIRNKGGFNFSQAVHCVRPPYDEMWAEFYIPAVRMDDCDVRMGAYIECYESGAQTINESALVASRKNLTVEEIQILQENARDSDQAKVTFTEKEAMRITLKALLMNGFVKTRLSY